MKAIRIKEAGGPDVLELVEYPKPEPGKGEVLIEVRAAGVNRPDVLQRMGLYKPPADASPLPGLEVSGVIVGGDTSASDFSIGDEVCALTPGGGYAEYCITPAVHCLPLPRKLNMLEAASLPETCFTVWSNVFERGQLAEGETLLVQGGSSGIGITAIQMAVAFGHRVFATAGSQTKVQACEQLGATGINYREEDFVERIKELTEGRGADVILDMVGGDYLARELQCLADDGRLVLIGLLGGARGELPLWEILSRRLTITGSTLRPRSNSYKASLASALRRQVWSLVESGSVQPMIHECFPLREAAEAHRLMESSQHIGKIVLEI